MLKSSARRSPTTKPGGKTSGSQIWGAIAAIAAVAMVVLGLIQRPDSVPTHGAIHLSGADGQPLRGDSIVGPDGVTEVKTSERGIALCPANWGGRYVSIFAFGYWRLERLVVWADWQMVIRLEPPDQCQVEILRRGQPVAGARIELPDGTEIVCDERGCALCDRAQEGSTIRVAQDPSAREYRVAWSDRWRMRIELNP